MPACSSRRCFIPAAVPRNSEVVTRLQVQSSHDCKKFNKKIWRLKNNVYLCNPKRKREHSSAGLEHLPYKQGVTGSNPVAPTKTEKVLSENLLRNLPEPERQREMEETREHSSAGLEHLPYKQGVTGSNPVAPTILRSQNKFFIVYFKCFGGLHNSGAGLFFFIPTVQEPSTSTPLRPSTPTPLCPSDCHQSL